MFSVQRDSLPVLLICLVLAGLGLVMIYSSSSALAYGDFGDPGFYLKKLANRLTEADKTVSFRL